MTLQERKAKLKADMRYNLSPDTNTKHPCKCGRWTRGCFEKCVCCQADELREMGNE